MLQLGTRQLVELKFNSHTENNCQPSNNLFSSEKKKIKQTHSV